jgi:DNA repair exonuclease SbcCD ATPase subunit
VKLRSLHIQKLPGIQPGFELNGLGTGVNVIAGPNACGKSSLMRALGAVLYRNEQRLAPLHIEAVFDDAEGALAVARLGSELTWRRDGQVIEPPPLPEHRFLPCFTLRIEDLLETDGAADQDIAERLARELAGGYDLQSIRNNPRFQPKPARGHVSESRQLRDARQAFSQRRREQQALQAQEARLDELRRNKEAATAAQREAAAYGKALALLEARRRREAFEARLAEFPPGMERLRGDELQELDRLRSETMAQAAALEKTRRERADTEEQLCASGLAETELTEAALFDCRHQVQRLRRLETDMTRQREALAEARANRDYAREALGGGDSEHLPRLQPDSIHQVEQQLGGKRRLDAAIRQLDAELENCPAVSRATAAPETILTARLELLHWLSAPRRAKHRARWGGAAIAFAAAAAGIVAAGVAVHWAFGLLFIPLIAGMAWAYLRADSGDSERRSAQQRFMASGLSEPQRWEPNAVSACLQALDRELREAEQAAATAARRKNLLNRRSLRAQELDTAHSALAALAAEAGYDPQRLDASLERWTKLVDAYDRADRAGHAAQAALTVRGHDANELRQSLIGFLRDYAEAPENEESDADILGESLERLAARIRQRDAARQQIKSAERDAKRLTAAIDRLDERSGQIYLAANLGQGDQSALRQRLDQRKTWMQVMDTLHEARVVERERARELGDRTDLIGLVEAGDEATLQTERQRLEAQAAQREPLLQEIAGIETQIAAAGRERALEKARAQAQSAEDALRARLDEELFALAGSFLLEQVAAEHVRASQPAALSRASDWFRRFTHYQYELIFETDGTHRFAARETASDERRSLSELSSGTRMQLLLAVRVAFALEAERGRESLPLLLDEALTTADPERFQAAAKSLKTLADEGGHQIFYLTAQPDDIAYWNAEHINACYIDLAQVRRRGAAFVDPARIRLPALPDIPAPDGHSPAEYAVLLGVAPLDPWADAAAAPVFCLLRDDLKLLQHLLQAGLERLGQLRSALESEAAPVLFDEAARQRLPVRIAATETWFDAWRYGRGRPVDRQALIDSGAVSNKFIDTVCALNEKLDGSASALIERLQNGEVNRFRTDKCDALREWLLEQGYLDEREPLTKNNIERRVLATLAAGQKDSQAALREAQLLCASLYSCLYSQIRDSHLKSA